MIFMKKGIDNPSLYVPYSRVLNKVGDFFVNLLPKNEDLGSAKRISGYKTDFWDISISGRSYDVFVSCKIQAPDGEIGEVTDGFVYIPSNFASCWKNRSKARERLQETIRKRYPKSENL